MLCVYNKIASAAAAPGRREDFHWPAGCGGRAGSGPDKQMHLERSTMQGVIMFPSCTQTQHTVYKIYIRGERRGEVYATKDRVALAHSLSLSLSLSVQRFVLYFLLYYILYKFFLFFSLQCIYSVLSRGLI